MPELLLLRFVKGEPKELFPALGLFTGVPESPPNVDPAVPALPLPLVANGNGDCQSYMLPTLYGEFAAPESMS